jgi:hypothetical protein
MHVAVNESKPVLHGEIPLGFAFLHVQRPEPAAASARGVGVRSFIRFVARPGRREMR